MLALLFAVVLALPPLGWFMGWQGFALDENRNLAPPPDFRLTPLAALPAKIDTYYEDHVGFRGAIIHAAGLVLYGFLHEPSGNVIMGKSSAHGELPEYFYVAEGIIEDRVALGQLTPTQLDIWKRSLESRASWLQRRGIAYLFVIMPEKSSVYPELLPDYLQTYIGPTRLDQFAKYFNDRHSSVPILNVKTKLEQNKPAGPLFFPFDSHWNGRASFFTYQAIVNALRPRFPDLTPGQMDRDFTIRPGPETLRVQLASMLGLAAVAPTPELAYIGTDTPQLAEARWPMGVDPSLNPGKGIYALQTPGRRRRLLVFHDSAFIAPLFSPESQPLAPHFARSYFAWLVPSDAAFQRFVQMEQPDLVVEEHGERILRLAPPPPAPLDPLSLRLPRSTAVPAFAIERINTRRAKPDFVMPRDGELRIEGWAFDRSAARPATGVEIVIDETPRPASYGLERSEAPDLPGCGDCNHAGFLADFSAEGLTPGPHTLGIRVISADGKSYSESTWGRVSVTPN